MSGSEHPTAYLLQFEGVDGGVVVSLQSGTVKLDFTNPHDDPDYFEGLKAAAVDVAALQENDEALRTALSKAAVRARGAESMKRKAMAEGGALRAEVEEFRHVERYLRAAWSLPEGSFHLEARDMVAALRAENEELQAKLQAVQPYAPRFEEMKLSRDRLREALESVLAHMDLAPRSYPSDSVRVQVPREIIREWRAALGGDQPKEGGDDS